MPSGAARAQTTVIGSGAPRASSSSTALINDPPVASIGSSTITGRPASDSGSLLTYGSGWWVSSLRAMPMKPMSAFGQQLLRRADESEPGPQDRHHDRLHRDAVEPVRS